MSKIKRPPQLLVSAAVISFLILIVMIYAARSAAPAPTTPAETGWKTENSGTYYLLHDGSKATGWQEIDGGTYYFRDSGVMVTGWQNIGGQAYYFLANGQTAAGSLTINGETHHFADNGTPFTGWYQLEGKDVYLDSVGKICTGWLTIDGIAYHFDQNGSPTPGWLEENGKQYYIKENGSVARGRNVIDNIVHYFTSTGEKVLLVNPWNALPEDYTVTLKTVSDNYQIADYAYDDLQQMLSDCTAAGCSPTICSAYRTQEYQDYLFQRKIKRLIAAGMSREQAEKEAPTVVAYPGTSEHQLGLALDIVDRFNQNLDQSQENTKTQQWLMANSWEYGWILRYPNGKTELTGIIYEPWHYRYVGKELAAELHELDLCLEEYLQMLTDTVG